MCRNPNARFCRGEVIHGVGNVACTERPAVRPEERQAVN
jgi:hypothetical protein